MSINTSVSPRAQSANSVVCPCAPVTNFVNRKGRSFLRDVCNSINWIFRQQKLQITLQFLNRLCNYLYKLLAFSTFNNSEQLRLFVETVIATRIRQIKRLFLVASLLLATFRFNVN